MLTTPSSTPARKAPGTLPSPPTTATIKARIVKSKPALMVIGDVIDLVTATSPASAALEGEDQPAHDVRVDARQLRTFLVLDHRAHRPAQHGESEERSEHRANDDRHDRGEQTPGADVDAEDLDRATPDVQAERLIRVPPHQQPIDDEGHTEQQEQPEKHCCLPRSR